MGPPVDAALTLGRLERAVKHRQMLVPHVRRTFDRVVLVNEPLDLLHLRGAVAQRPQTVGHRPVDDLHRTATRQLLVLDQRNVRLDAGRVAVHHEADGAGGGQDGGLRIAEAMLPAGGQDLVPQSARGILEILRAGVIDVLDRIPVHLHHAEHRLAVLGKPLERPQTRRTTPRWSDWPPRAAAR